MKIVSFLAGKNVIEGYCMAIVANKRSIMTLYSGSLDIFSHRVRIVLAEKGVAVDVINADSHEKLEDLLELNPYGNVPTLIDRELVLYDANIIMEYLDERFPHPPLMPVYPVARAKTRLMIYRIDREWGALVRQIETGTEEEAQNACKELRNYLIKLAPVFANSAYFLNEDFTLVDCCIAPILWRLPSWGITLPPEAKSVIKYAERVFNRDSFQASLTEAEQDLRKVAKAETA
jgi:RNA polymerase-associated protein